MAKQEEWISVTDAAKVAGYTQDHIRRLIREQAIVAKKVVTVWLIRRDSLMNYLKRVGELGERRGAKSKKALDSEND